DQVVVEIVAAIMEHARSRAMAFAAMASQAVAYPDITAWFLAQHEGEVFRAHGGRDAAIHVVGPHNAIEYLGAEISLFFMLDGGRVIALEGELGLAVQCLSGVFCDFGHPGFYQVERLVGARAPRASYVGVVRDDVVGRPGMNLSNAEHRG